MFKQVKKARALMDEPTYKHDEFNLSLIMLVVIFSISIVGIWYYFKEANKRIDDRTPTTNNIINIWHKPDDVEGIVDDYGGFHPLNKEENELSY